MKKVSMPTAIVQAAQKRYPQILSAAVQHIGVDPPYGKQKVTSQTYDNQLVRMLPDQLAQLAQTDPAAAQSANARIATLRQKAAGQIPLPAQDSYEPRQGGTQ